MKVLFIVIAGLPVHAADPEPFPPVPLQLQLSPTPQPAVIEKRFEPVSPADAKGAATHVQQGKAFYSQRRFDDAINAFTKALALDRTNKEAHEWLFKTVAQKGWSTPSPTPTPSKAK